MIALFVLAVVLLLATLWSLLRPLRPGAPAIVDAAVSERGELAQLRDRLLGQMRELDAERADRGMDAASAVDEEARLAAELAGVLKRLDAAPAPAGAAPAPARPRWPAALVLAAALTGGAGLYGWHNAANLHGFVLAARSGASAANVPPMVFEMVVRLEQQLRDHPDDADSWARLARAYAVMERTGDALAAYEKSYALAPDNAAMLADYAWVLFNQDPGQTTGRVNELYTRLHRLDARNPDALWFLGFAAYQQGEFRKATGYWERLLKLLPPEDPGRVHLQQAIASAREQVRR